MKNVLSKLRIGCFILKMHLLIWWSKITDPFKIVVWGFKRYMLLRKIDKESQDNWERYVKIRKIESKDEFDLRRQQFFSLKVQFICTFFRTSMLAGFYALSQEHPNEVDDEFLSKIDGYRDDFKKEKAELIRVVNEIKSYDEITFDEEMESKIIAWEFEDYKTTEEISEMEKRFANYINTLDLVH